ncbi:MAG: glutamine--tRNA ligase/YqeY domain fusion protein [bacterium]
MTNIKNNEEKSERAAGVDFIREIINEDNKTGKYNQRVHTRFPPEPNGYLHIGHAKSICLNFGIAKDYNGKCNLRFDDTNPSKEDTEYVDSIQEDVKWLGFDWEDRMFYASDYFGQLFDFAVQLIKSGDAYVCDLDSEDMRKYRGTLTEPGKDSPYRNRTIEDNLALFMQMKNGDFSDGSKTLRAKVDMSSPNVNMRDPVMYRILRATHHRTGDTWCIYPMYDFAHGQSDSVEGITHSICTLEFEDHRPLYDWFVEKLGIYHPQQIEFARLNITYTVLSKRKLLKLVNENYVSGWDDPRMPTICGLRRRGYTPEALRTFCARIGVTKVDGIVDIAMLEDAVRDDLNQNSQRVMAVLRPLKVVITNYPDDLVEEMDAANNPGKPEEGTRKVPFCKEIYIEQDDFREVPPPKYYRLSPGKEVRLRSAYFVKCEEVIKNENGEVVEVHCTYDPDTKGGDSKDGRKVKATLHWVSARHALETEVRLYDHLFMTQNPDVAPEGKDFLSNLNPDSLETVTGYIEPFVMDAIPGTKYQFERLGYFTIDTKDTTEGKIVFNRTATLRDTWAKIENKQDK